jgi:RNA 3'-terminal phosphate cyclase (ATP)
MLMGVRRSHIGSNYVQAGSVRGGAYRFTVGTAGSGTLVFQTALPALMLASEASSVVIEGGTHNQAALPYHFLAQTFHASR